VLAPTLSTQSSFGVSIITFDIAGTRALAQHAPNGVYSMVSKELRAKGNPALRKKLEHNVQVS